MSTEIIEQILELKEEIKKHENVTYIIINIKYRMKIK